MPDRRMDDGLEEQIDSFLEVAETSSSACIIAKAIAFSDSNVKNIMAQKLSNGDIFIGHRCVERMPSWELIYVYFEFDCKPGTACIIKPSFIAVVNLLSKQVVDIIDPAIVPKDADPFSIFQTLGERTFLTFGNYSGRDIHIEVTCDVHTGKWGPELVHSNQEPQVKSKNVSFNDYAKYCVKVWKNDAGSQGEYVGDFEHSIRLDYLGNRDHLIMSIINVGGEDHLQAWSVKKAGEIALLLWGVS